MLAFAPKASVAAPNHYFACYRTCYKRSNAAFITEFMSVGLYWLSLHAPSSSLLFLKKKKKKDFSLGRNIRTSFSTSHSTARKHGCRPMPSREIKSTSWKTSFFSKTTQKWCRCVNGKLIPFCDLSLSSTLSSKTLQVWLQSRVQCWIG
ncbi:unnamed protein product [Ixodes persulcatus]